MAKYGDTAKKALRLITGESSLSPRDAWRAAARDVFPDSGTAQSKGCPRDTFLALCETGAVESVPPGSYTGSVENKRHALQALAALRTDASLVDDPATLWAMTLSGEKKTHNAQMDVVATLFRDGLIR